MWTFVIPPCDTTTPAPGTQSPDGGGAINSCPLQNDYIAWSFNKLNEFDRCDSSEDCIAEGSCCEVEVCAELDYSKPNCRKSGTISHVCKKASGECNPRLGFYDAMEINTGVDDGFLQCQRGVPGQTLQFMFKDGAGCNTRQKASDPDPSVPVPASIALTGTTVAIDCAPRECCIDPETGECGTGGAFKKSLANQLCPYSSCTGNSAGVECVWELTVPDCTAL